MEIYLNNNQKYYIDPKTNQIVYITDESGKLIYETDQFVDISYKSSVSLSRMLSNLYPYEFKFKSNKVNSIEGVIQALKHPEIDIQKLVLKYSGVDAYHTRGASSGPYKILYWMGEKMYRFDVEYQLFLNDLFLNLYYQNALFRKALDMVGDRCLLHSIGKVDPSITTLTVSEYIKRLNILKSNLLNLDEKVEELETLANELVDENVRIKKINTF